MAEFDQSTWFRVLDIVKRDLANERTFSIWFSPIKFVSATEEIITLEVPNKFFRDWLLGSHINIINSGVLKTSGREFKIDFRLTENGFPENPAGVKAAGEKRDKGFWPFAREKQGVAREIGLNPKYTFESFVVGSSNRFVHAASIAVCDAPAKAYNPLFIYGGVGLGKTHLMHAIGQRVLQKNSKLKVVYITSEDFTNHLINAIQTKTASKFREKYRNVDVLLIDDIQFIAGKESTQEEFFNTFNTLHDAHKQIVVSSDRPPKDIHTLEERLVSRFGWGLVTDIQPPDFETRMAILKKKSEMETVSVPDDVFYFLADKIRSNIRELEGALIRVVAYAKLMGNPVSLDLVKIVLKDMISEGEKKITIDLIQLKVCDHFNIRLADMKIKKRSKGIVYPRQIAMYLARKLTDYSLPEIGEYFGGRDHTTVMHACEKIGGDMKAKRGVDDLINRLIRDVKG